MEGSRREAPHDSPDKCALPQDSCTEGHCSMLPAVHSPAARTSVIRRAPPEFTTEASTSSVTGCAGSLPNVEELKGEILEGTSEGSEEGRCRKRGVGSRLELPLREKIKVIKARDSGKTMRQIATEFGCGKTQILNILSRRERYQKEWDVVCKVGGLGGGADRKRAARRTGNEETNRRVYHWWREAEANGVRVTGPLLQSTARTIARKLGFENFAASNGWLASFRKTYGVQLKHDLAMNRHMGFNVNHPAPRCDVRVPKIEEVPASSDRAGSLEVHDTIDSKSLVEVLMEDDPTTVSPFKSEVPSSKSPSLDSVPEEVPPLLIFVKRHAQGYRLISLVYPDEEDNWWLEIRRKSASYVVPHFGYRSHLSRLIISHDLGFWHEVLGDCVKWGSLCNPQGDLDLCKLDSILLSLQSDVVCAGSGDVNVKSRDHQQVRFASALHLPIGAFISRPDFRFRSFNCARLLPSSKSEAVCRSCQSLPPETAALKSESRLEVLEQRSTFHQEEVPPSEYVHPKKRLRISYSDALGSSSKMSPPEQQRLSPDSQRVRIPHSDDLGSSWKVNSGEQPRLPHRLQRMRVLQPEGLVSCSNLSVGENYQVSSNPSRLHIAYAECFDPSSKISACEKPRLSPDSQLMRISYSEGLGVKMNSEEDCRSSPNVELGEDRTDRAQNVIMNLDTQYRGPSNFS